LNFTIHCNLIQDDISAYESSVYWFECIFHHKCHKYMAFLLYVRHNVFADWIWFQKICCTYHIENVCRVPMWYPEIISHRISLLLSWKYYVIVLVWGKYSGVLFWYEFSLCHAEKNLYCIFHKRKVFLLCEQHNAF